MIRYRRRIMDVPQPRALPPPAADSSVLGAAMRALSVGSWGTMTTSNSFNPDPSGAGDAQFSYVQRALYRNGKIYMFGGSHGTGGAGFQRLWLSVYDLDTNSWLYLVHWPHEYIDYEHGFYCGCVDGDGNYVGHDAYGGGPINVWQLATQTFGSTISTPPNGLPSSGIFYAFEWHPNLAGGSLVYTNEWCLTYRPQATGTWNDVYTTYPAGKAIGASCYNPADDAVYIGGLDGTGNALYKLTNSGSRVARASAPNGWGVWDATVNTTSAMVAGCGPNSKLLQICRDETYYEYDHVGDSWSGSLGTVPSGLISTGAVVVGASCVFCAVNDPARNIHGVVAFKLGTLTSTSTTAHLLRRE